MVLFNLGESVLETSANIRRKTLVAREDLVNRVNMIAKAQGRSSFELVNELLMLVIVSDKLNFNLKCVVDERKILEVAKSSGFILGLERLWYEMADIVYKKDKTLALKNWFDSGVWFASRYVTGEVSSSFESFKSDLTVFTWNAPEFTLELVGNRVFVKVTSPRFTEAYTFLFASFLVGALESFGYRPVRREVSRGIIRLDTVRNMGNDTT